MSEPRQLLHYVLTSKLGQGGMGEVWQATDTTLDRQVAIKVLPEALSGDAERLARFEREAKLLAALNHPNIATIHGFHAESVPPFLAMELVEGQPLSALLPSDGLPLKRLFELAVPLSDALGAAHERGITHRDLKPDNVMVSNEGRVKVLDFGLAKLAGEAAAGIGEPGQDTATAIATASITQEGKILGTVNYMSPEQAEGKATDARSDVFSLGILLYEMAVGRRPFSGDTAISTLSSILKDTPPSLTELKGNLPRHLDRVVRRCLAKDPQRRYPNAREVRNELEQLKAEIDSGEVTSVSTPSTPVAAPAPGRSRRWIRLAVVGLAAASLVAVVGKIMLAPPDAPSGPAAPVGVDAAAEATSIAVLPFVDLSPEGDKEYFGDGIAEELINRLARVRGIRVTGRTSSFAFKGTDQDLRAIGESLDVETIIEGSVRSAGDRVRVTAQLVGVSDGFQLWSETYDRSLSDIFAVQDEIAGSIVGALRRSLGGGAGLGETRAGQVLTDDVEAYQLYLKARHLYQQRTGESLVQAIELYGQAVERDPEFAQAHAALASAWLVSPGYTDYDDDDVREPALQAAARAIQLDPDNAEAHAVRAGILSGDRRWIEADAAYRRAIEARPDDPITLMWYGGELLGLGRVDEGARLLQRAYEIDPASGVINGWIGHVHRARGEDEDAIRLMREATRLGWGAGEGWIADVIFETGRVDEAVEFLRSVDRLGDGRAKFYAGLLAARKDNAARTRFLRGLVEAPLNASTLEACIQLDAVDEAFVLLDKVERHIKFHQLMRLWSPAAAAIRRDPRFIVWARKQGLVEYWESFGWPDTGDVVDTDGR